MTSRQRNGRPITSFSRWARGNANLDARTFGLANMDVDWVWHQYLTPTDTMGQRTVNHIMFIEEKAHCSELSYAQRDVIKLLNQALGKADKQLLATERGEKVMTRLWGYFRLRYSGDDVGCAESIWWDSHSVDLPMLERILRFEVNPRTLLPRNDRRHHKFTDAPLFAQGEDQ